MEGVAASLTLTAAPRVRSHTPSVTSVLEPGLAGCAADVEEGEGDGTRQGGGGGGLRGGGGLGGLHGKALGGDFEDAVGSHLAGRAEARGGGAATVRCHVAER